MKRKLIQLSPSTGVVSLPSPWIKANKLKKGEELFLDIEDNRVIISTKSSKSEKEIKIDISELGRTRLMWVAIDAVYVAGYDSIIVKTGSQEQTAFMTKVVRYFPGMIIFSERKNMVHFKAMAESEGELDKIVSRVFNLNVAMLEDALEGLKTKDWKLLADMKRRDYVINSYVSLCFRHMNKFGFTPFSKTGVMHSYLKVIEMISDKLCLLFVAMAEKKEVKIKVVSLILEMYKHEQRMHFNYSQEKLVLLEEKRQELKKSLKNVSKNILPYLNEVAELFFDLEELEMQLNV